MGGTLGVTAVTPEEEAEVRRVLSLMETADSNDCVGGQMGWS